MSSDFSNPSQDDPLQPGDAQAMETFTFDVSAREAAQLKKQSQAVQPTTQARSHHHALPTRKELATNQEATRYFADPRVPQTSASKKLVRATPKIARRGMPFWFTSFLVHAAALLLLSFATLAVPQKQDDLGWTASTTAFEEEVESFQEVEIDLPEDLESIEAELASELTDLGMAALGDLSEELALADVSNDAGAFSESLGDLGKLFGESGNGLAELGQGLGAKATASFFGTKIEGKRILFMLDNSGGMKKGKLETLIEELLKSVDSLRPKQEFYVIFYSDTVYPLFYPRSATNFVYATAKNKKLLQEWLETVELCSGNRIDEAMEAANVIRPDMVFLLTDGKLFTTDAKKRILLNGTSREFPINTFGMGVRKNSTPAEELRLVAEANRGSYHAIKVTNQAKERAYKNQRPYHSKQPGLLWGKQVSKSWGR